MNDFCLRIYLRLNIINIPVCNGDESTYKRKVLLYFPDNENERGWGCSRCGRGFIEWTIRRERPQDLSRKRWTITGREKQLTERKENNNWPGTEEEKRYTVETVQVSTSRKGKGQYYPLVKVSGDRVTSVDANNYQHWYPLLKPDDLSAFGRMTSLSSLILTPKTWGLWVLLV